ncbi:MAG: hypothetical protein OFPI_33720 [Osedax symbiont Rs2]|nr:MAG: hypothetical protein OFPI_33720 [Osedax symbiont Rs2]
MLLRKSQPSDMPFLRDMLYQGVYWRAIANDTPPAFEQALADPQVAKALAGWGECAGDQGVVAVHNSIPIGAAWYRFWTDEDNIRGYIEEDTPALIIAVHSDYRDRGVGKQLLEWLVEHAASQGIGKISLMVAKDNQAINLYRKCGFTEHADTGASVLMLRTL